MGVFVCATGHEVLVAEEMQLLEEYIIQIVCISRGAYMRASGLSPSKASKRGNIRRSKHCL